MDGKSMFGDIKSKLGFGRKNDYEEFYEDYEEFEEGDDYGEYGYDESSRAHVRLGLRSLRLGDHARARRALSQPFLHAAPRLHR